MRNRFLPTVRLPVEGEDKRSFMQQAGNNAKFDHFYDKLGISI
jgi:hypothetical protein